MDFLRKFDSSGRTPRDVQVTALRWLADNWNSAEAFTLQLPVATGKSALAKAIIDAAGGHVITPSNLLINQYSDTYPKTNFLKGKAHYTCSSGLSCEDWTNVLEQKPCPGCPYVECKKKALQAQSTFFNPMSLFFTSMDKSWHTPPVLVVDEAHQLPSMISMLSGTKLRHSMYKFTDQTISELNLVPWLDAQVVNLSKLATYYGKDKKRLKEIVEELERLKLVKIGVESDAANYAVWIDRGLYRGKPDRFLNIKPIRPPRRVVQSLLDARKIVLLSGTLMPADIVDLVGDRRTLSLDLPSPIPKERRPIYYRPVSFKMNMTTPAEPIVAAIEAIIREFPGRNTIIHVSYALSKKLRNSFSMPVIFNDPEDKQKKLDLFLQKGGVFLASGCSEGIDLKGDLCHINVITKLLFPNLGDPVVSKRKALADGEEWFALETLKTTIQQAGRSTRSPEDYSKTFILDPSFARLYRQYKGKLPQSFNESINWGGR
jgi:Rad3-related DNA helicase